MNTYTKLHIKIYHLGNGRMHKIIKVYAMIKAYCYIYHMDHMGEHNSSLCNFDAKLVILTYRGMSQVNQIFNLLILK